MEFFQSQPTVATVSIDGKQLTALDCAKIIAFQKRHFISWSNDMWVSVNTAYHALANFFFGDEDGMRPQREAFYAKFNQYEDAFSMQEYEVLSKATDIVCDWGKLKLYTCLTKNEDGTRSVNTSKLETMLGIDLPSEATARLQTLVIDKDEDGDWKFLNIFGGSFYDTATEGLLYEVRHAINLQHSLSYHADQAMRDGYQGFDDICNKMMLKTDRLTAIDRTFLATHILDSNIKPEEYTVFYTRHNDFSLYVADEAPKRYNFAEPVKNFKSRREALHFVNDINDAYAVQKKRNMISRQITELEQQLEELKGKLDLMVK
jgi:hypothetical protein